MEVRVEADLGSDRMNAKIRKAQLMKVPYMLVIGENEQNAGLISVRVRDGSQQKDVPLSEFAVRVQNKIAMRSPEL